jgi:hypothetical protein
MRYEMPLIFTPDRARIKLCFSFLVFGAKILVTALTATGCANCIAGVAMHTYFYIE